MTIDEALDYIDDINPTVTWEEPQTQDEDFFCCVNDWLEELKELMEYFNTKEIGTYRYNKGKTDALNDFIKKAEEERDNIYNWDEDEYENGMRAGYQYSIEIAEQLKGEEYGRNKKSNRNVEQSL